MNSLSHVCPEEAPAALDMLDRRTVRRVVAEQSGRVLFQFFARPIVREAALRPTAEPTATTTAAAENKTEAGAGSRGDNNGEDDDETLTQLVARAEEKALVPLEEYELPPVRAICFGHDTCTCHTATTDTLCVCLFSFHPFLLFFLHHTRLREQQCKHTLAAMIADVLGPSHCATLTVPEERFVQLATSFVDSS